MHANCCTCAIVAIITVANSCCPGANEIKDPETQNVGIELWDYKAAKSFQGEAQINLKDILDRGRMRETYR